MIFQHSAPASAKTALSGDPSLGSCSRNLDGRTVALSRCFQHGVEWGWLGSNGVEIGGRGEGGRKNLDIWPSGDRAHRNSSALKPTPNWDDLHPSPRKGGAVWGPQPGMMWDGWGGARGIAR